MKSVRFLGEGCPALVERDAQLSLSLLSLAGLDEDHTIRTLNTVKRGRGSVLEDGDALDLIHVYGADVVTLHTVHKDQRTLSIGCRSSSKVHCGAIDTRLASTTLHGCKTCDTSCKSVVQTCGRGLAEIS